METVQGKRDFVGYEYKEITVSKEMESLYTDGYQNFGWQPEQWRGGGVAVPHGIPQGINPRAQTVTLRFKRDRKILNKAELTRLQRQFDACTREILVLEQSRTTKGMIAAMVIGIVGCGFLAGSVFAVTAAPPKILLCVLLSIPGFVGWILPYFVYRALTLKRDQEVTPLIEGKYDEIYETCEKANHLLVK